MNPILRRNLEQLEIHHPLLAKKLLEITSASDRFIVETTRSGDISVQVKVNDKWQTLTSKYSPRNEAYIQVEKQWNPNAETVVVLGIGGFYHIEEILVRTSEKVNVIVIGADPELFKLILSYRDLTHVLSEKRLLIYVGDDLDIIYSLFRLGVERDIFDLPEVCILEHPVECKMYPSFYDLCRKRLVDAYRQGLANVATRVTFGDQWVRNILANLPDIMRAGRLEDLHNCFKDKPAILVSAGPSLNKNIHLLKDIGDRALIVCVDTAYRALQKEGIVPHLLITVDGSHLNYKHFEGVDYSNIPLVMEMSVHEEIVKHHKGPKAVICSINDFTPWLEEAFGDDLKALAMPTGGSVATTAFSVIEYMGCDPLIFVGQDLSYPGGQAYAAGTRFENLSTDEIQKRRELIPIKDIYGNDIFTTHDYLVYLKWFEGRMYSGKRTYINATEGGALYNGVKIMTLQEAIARYCREVLPIHEMMEKMSYNQVSWQRIRYGYRKMRQTIAQLRKVNSDLQTICDRMNEFITALEEGERERTSNLVHEINSLEKRIERYKLALMFMDATAYREVFSDIHFEKNLSLQLDSREKDLAACRQSLHFYKQLHTVSQRSIEMLELYSKRYYERFCDMEEMKAQ
ncbi:hypothetical protein DNHGIG_10460 [Collibacillus ludicampi]|uniref:6-hydroxymethylpterin diphosphokinase MptE-like domain-containing protein n=1 Tax=Collibacillus ludicampi TaxID=2771369 RepID=A0AAV4LCF5_9BACL|nr:6-hydroxymethylpterin diphosphokinase MptE-like protein [Collibacillus ludicampi]GIM45497.1 hypothetical protein DNHGIG_10460 [Collibacillus ludicampi]